jgi:hypothetical protein
MIDARHHPTGSPAACRHRTFIRVGIQRAPLPPYRLYLLTCRDCGTTLTTQTIRGRRESSRRSPAPSAALEEDCRRPPRRRRAG